MLDIDIKNQLVEYLSLLQEDVVIQLHADSSDSSKETRNFIEEIVSMTEKITLVEGPLDWNPSFSISQNKETKRIQFAGVPLGHEFTSFVLALLQVSGRPPKIQESLFRRIKRLHGPYQFTTYMSLSCHNCPDVVQALNLLSVLNPSISTTTVNGGDFTEIMKEKEILAVPAVYLNDTLWLSGKSTLEEILERLEELEGLIRDEDTKHENELIPFDVLVIGGGPAGSSAAIYASRKGIKTGIIANDFGGQVKDTSGIENLIGTLYTTGDNLASSLKSHIASYPVEIIETSVVHIEKSSPFRVLLKNNQVVFAKTIILATGATWRNTGAPGEQEFKNKGVAYCPHCDGPLFAGQSVAVIGGGNSGIEAAIDLSTIAKKVTVLEFLPNLKADQVLINKAESLSNLSIIKNVATKEITGNTKVTGLTYINRTTNEEQHLSLEGVFVQIGLRANTDWLIDVVEKNEQGEIIVDAKQSTSVPGIFGAGDCTNSAYKQIIISMGSGASAALSAFDYLIRH